MRFKEGAGWKACHDESSGRYFGEYGGIMAYHLYELTEEPVSLFEQLPEELPRRQQARILKAYYGGILDEVNQLKNKR